MWLSTSRLNLPQTPSWFPCSSIQGLQTTVHKHQVAALTLTGLVFMVGIGRTEVEVRTGVCASTANFLTLPLPIPHPSQGVCVVLAIALNFLLLACLCWLLAGGVLVARILFSPQPKTKFAKYLYIIGWGESLIAQPGFCPVVSPMCSSSPGSYAPPPLWDPSGRGWDNL